MARTSLTKTISPGSYTNNNEQLNFQTGDATNGNKFTAVGGEIVVAKNTDGASGHSITVVSVDDRFGRQEDISFTVPAGETHIFGPFKLHGWQQSDGAIYLDCGTTDIDFAIIQT